MHQMPDKTAFCTVDRIEGTIAVLELPDGSHRNLAQNDWPVPLAEGDVLEMRKDGCLIPAPSETKRRRQANAALLESLWES